jgi:uncharacterized protein (TIGR00369 family)
MTDEPMARTGAFWDLVEGRVPMPPSAQLLGWELEHVDTTSRTITVRFEARAEFTNLLGNVQGGFLAAMLDDTMAPALLATLPPGRYFPTLEMKVSFLRPARPGPLWGHGRVVYAGRTNAFVEGELVDEAQRLIARGSATLYLVEA